MEVSFCEDEAGDELCALFLFFLAAGATLGSIGELSHKTRSMGVKLRCWRDVSSALARSSDKGSLPRGVWGQSRRSLVSERWDKGCGGGIICGVAFAEPGPVFSLFATSIFFLGLLSFSSYWNALSLDFDCDDAAIGARVVGCEGGLGTGASLWCRQSLRQWGRAWKIHQHFSLDLLCSKIMEVYLSLLMEERLLAARHSRQR